MLSQQELSDRFEIQDLLYNYADIIDSQEFDKLRDIFTEDAHIDYSAFGGAVGNLEEIIEFLKSAMIGLFPNTQHLNASPVSPSPMAARCRRSSSGAVGGAPMMRRRPY